jgi:tetratricopeptide (TPR) repeat protein
MRQAPEHRSLDNALNALGQLYLSLGGYEAAKDLLCESFELRKPQLGENSINLIDTGLALGIAYQALKMPEEANRRLDEALGALQHGKFSFASILDNLELLASILRQQGDEKRAEEVLQLSLSISEEQHFEDWRKPQTLSLLAEISMAQHQPAKAKEQLLKAYRILDEYSKEAEQRVRSPKHGENFNRVSRRLMQQIVAMSESLNGSSETGDWQSKLDAIDSYEPPQLLKTQTK